MSELSLKISGKRFDFFDKFDVTLMYNSIASTFSFEGLILTDDQKQLFRPLSYHDVQVYFGDDLFLTGIGLNISTSIENALTLGNISGYSKTGVLEDCEIPLSLYPLQSDNLSLSEITEKLIKPFGIKLITDQSVITSASKKYPKTTSEHEQKIKDYITTLAGQRNIIVTHNNEGNLIFTSLNVNSPSVAVYDEGMPSTRISVTTNGQGMHSQISVIKQATIEVDTTGEQTITNNLISKYRPIVRNQTSGDNNDTISTAEMIFASELRNITLQIETDRWKWSDGKKETIIKPNMIIEVISPSNFINNRTRFFVEKVNYKGDNTGIIATIDCVLPECYTGKQPKNIFA